jgi:hypothetical protein
MSRHCHFFREGILTPHFRVKVGSIVTATYTFDRQSLPFRTDFHVAGTHCLLATNSYEILRAATLRPANNHRNGRSFHMDIVVDPNLDSRPVPAAHFRGLRHMVFAILPPRSFITYDLLRRHVHAVLSTANANDESFWTLLLPITIGLLGTTMGVTPLHCACLDRKEEGLLIGGGSGAGKSTLSAALAQRGFGLVSEGWTYVSEQRNALVAHGIFARMKLLPDAVQFFSELRAFTPKPFLNGEVAYHVDPCHFPSFTVKEVSHPRRIIFLERTPSRGCRFVPCRPEFVRDFLEQSTELLPEELPEARATRSRIIQVLSRCPSWILRTGDSPQQTATAVEEFLSEAAHGAS